MKKRILSSLLALFLVLAFGACGEDISTPEPNAEAGTWAIYWYLCGSDLESNGGFATSDLMEMMEVALPENVRVVIQTGGAKTWQNDVVDADILQRYVYDSEGLTLVDELPPASMGDAATLTDFLRYCKQNYPAEKTAVLFWNHGGGSVSGAAFDERYGYDSLTLDEMQTAFGRVWEADENNPPLELVGFDTCLMATVDVAGTFAGTAHYLVASEEVEPANGWDYTGWLGALAADPAMDGAALGEVICDAYYAGCQAVGTHSNATLSLTDLTRTGPLLEAYEAFGAEALAAACEDPGFFSRFARIAAQSENYGGNTREQGYTNMVDLGHMARQSTGLLQTAGDVLNALEDCVLYRVSGPYRAESTGLSCYYSYNGDLNDLYGYTNVGAGVYYVVMAIYNLVIGIIVSVYMLGSKETFKANAKRVMYTLFSVDTVKKIFDGLDFTDKTFMGFINGKLLDSAIIGLICYIGCVLLRMPYALLISVIVGVTNVIPFFGPFIGAVPSALLVLLVDPFKCLIFVIFIIVLQQVDGNIIGPKVLGSSIGINGFWVMFSIILGGGLFGFWGMLLGVPVFVVIYTALGKLVTKKLVKRELPTDTDEYMNIDHIDPVTREIIEKEKTEEDK